MRVLVTGSGGFIGAALTRALDTEGFEVIGVDIRGNGRPSPPRVTTVAGDVCYPDEWSGELEGVDVVVHSAAVHHADTVYAHPARSIEVNVLGTRAVLEAAVEARVPRVVFLSSAKVYGNSNHPPSQETDLPTPVEPYGLAKSLCESYLDRFRADYGLQTVILRPFSVYGPEQDLNTGYIGAILSAAQRGLQPTLPGQPSYRRDFVYVDDVVDATVAAIGSDSPGIVNVASGQPLSIAEAATIVAEMTGIEIDARYEVPRPGTIEVTHGSIDRFAALVGRTPTSFRAGILETVRSFGIGRQSA